MATTRGVDPFLKATLPTCVLRRRELSLHQHAPRSSPYDTGDGSHASCELAQDRRSQTAARGACNRPAVTSDADVSNVKCLTFANADVAEFTVKNGSRITCLLYTSKAKNGECDKEMIDNFIWKKVSINNIK